MKKIKIGMQFIFAFILGILLIASFMFATITKTWLGLGLTIFMFVVISVLHSDTKLNFYEWKIWKKLNERIK